MVYCIIKRVSLQMNAGGFMRNGSGNLVENEAWL